MNNASRWEIMAQPDDSERYTAPLNLNHFPFMEPVSNKWAVPRKAISVGLKTINAQDDRFLCLQTRCHR